MSLSEVEIHELANLTPSMTDAEFKGLKLSIHENGQQMPIKMYRGKCIDGRHRVKALRELGITEVLYENENSQLSLEDVRTKILTVYERRRHQTPTQKAILAYREYQRVRELGEKVGQGAIAESLGTTIKQLGRAKQLEEVAGKDIVELLFQGNKINIGTEVHPNNTDSLDSLINYFKKHREMIVIQTKSTNISEDYTDEEMLTLNDALNKLQSEYSHRMLSRLTFMLRSTLNSTNQNDIF
jgi:hypothetical protein